MTYRVWIDGLAPSTTYYYTVDAARADGNRLGLHSPVGKLTTRPRSWARAAATRETSATGDRWRPLT